MGEGPREEVGIAAHRQRPNGEARYTRRWAFQALVTRACFPRVCRKAFIVDLFA